MGLLRCITVLQANSRAEEGAQNAEHDAVRDTILDKVLKELIFDSKAEVRSAACVWLVALCTFTGKPPQLLRRLPEVQEAFSNLLGDSSELAQVLPPTTHPGMRPVVQCGRFVCGTANISRMLSACPAVESHAMRHLLEINQQGWRSTSV